MPLFSRDRISSITKADLARAAGDWNVAAAHYAEALTHNPERPDIWVQYGHALKESGRRLDAEAAYRRAIEGNPASADAHLQLAHLLKLQGRDEEAKPAYLRALALAPELADARRALAELGLDDGQIAEARAALAPLPPRSRRRPSRITLADRARELGQWAEAARLYRQALDRNPRNAPIWVQYGHMLRHLGDVPAAEAAYRHALAHEPRNPDSYLQLGRALKDQGKTEKAQSAYLRAFALEPAHPGPLSELQELGWSRTETRELSLGRGMDTSAVADDDRDNASPLDELHGSTDQERSDTRSTTIDDFDLRVLKPSGRIAVVLHLFDASLWPEMSEAIGRIGHPFDLFVSLTVGSSDHQRPTIFKEYPNAYIFNFPNIGRDIAPFFALLKSGVLFKYDLICKLHTKRSTHTTDGESWRQALIAGVLNDKILVDNIITGFDEDPDIGIVIADGNIFSGEDRWAGNIERLQTLLPRIGISPNVIDRSFPGGSIFWIRSLLLQPFAALDITLDDFEPEPLPIDGTLAHALERMFGLLCEDAGMRVVESSKLRGSGLPTAGTPSNVKIVALYLPQFHPTPENDKWWGKGFTEWTNVTKAFPLFKGHQQPRLPSDLGFYDLRLPEVRQAQADLAKIYGIDAFCYYYYWFNGRRVLERPLDEVLKTGKPEFPFMICWANEAWSRNWDGLNQDVLLAQTYEPGWETRFASDIAPLLRDPRYFRVDGNPMLSIYRIGQIPRPVEAVRVIRETLAAHGVPRVHLTATWVNYSGDAELPPAPQDLGLDAYFEFPPHGILKQAPNPLPSVPDTLGGLYDYGLAVADSLSRLEEPPQGMRHRGVMAGWDNTPRRLEHAHVFHGATPANFRRWLRGTVQHESHLPGDRVVFINAWNEWAEGTYLEPDQRYGHGWLQAVASAIGPRVTGRRRLQVYRRRALGDVLLATPILRALRRKFPTYEIVVTTEYPEILYENPNVDFVLKSLEPMPGFDETLVLDYETEPDLHIVDAYARCAGVSIDDRTPEIHLRDDEREAASRLLRDAGVNSAGPFCVMQINSGWRVRDWPLDRFKRVSAAIEKDGIPVVILGQGKEPAIDFGTDLRDMTTVRLAAAVIEKCAFAVTIDSSLMHIAYAFRRPVVALFGCTDPERRVPDWALPMALYGNVECRGCHHRQRPLPVITEPVCLWETVRCMESVSAEQVISMVKGQLLPPPQPTVSIIIPHYTKYDLVNTCLSSIFQVYSSITFEVIVVLDGSPDDSAARLEAWRPQVNVINLPTNLGFSGACNIGAKTARGRYILFLNNDTEVTPGWLDELVGFIESEPRVGIAGPKLLYPGDDGIQHCGTVFNERGLGEHIYRLNPRNFAFAERPRYYRALTGACLLIERTFFWALGGFDTNFHGSGGCEDTDLCFKVLEQGKVAGYCPSSVVYHYEGVTRGLRGPEHPEERHNRSMLEDRWGKYLTSDAADYYLLEKMELQEGNTWRWLRDVPPHILAQYASTKEAMAQPDGD